MSILIKQLLLKFEETIIIYKCEINQKILYKIQKIILYKKSYMRLIISLAYGLIIDN